MIGSREMRLVLGALAFVIAIYLLAGSRSSTDQTPEISNAVVVEPEQPISEQARDRMSANGPNNRIEDSGACLTLEQLEYHPTLVEDSYRFDTVGTTGPTIASYRGLSTPELRRLTVQGDSAAMVVLGAASMMRARGLPVTKAVPYLLLEDADLMSYTFERPFTPEYLAHMKQAGKWFYQAALHGRVLALFHVGDSLWFEKGGPVELGWIEEEEYNSLTLLEKNALLPGNVYNVLAYEIAPEIGTGPHGTILAQLILRSERQRRILDGLAATFFEDLHAAGLPPISVPEATAPPIEELTSLLCESELKRLDEAYSE